MNRTLITLMIAALPFAVMTPAMADNAPSAAQPAAQSTEVKKELQKLMNAFGAGELSSKEYKARKEALLKSASNTQLGQQ
jgi:hypothetical protein